MRNAIVVVVCAASVLLGPSAVSQVAPNSESSSIPSATGAQATKTHQELRDLQQVMETALNANDINGLLANVEDQVIFTTMNGDIVHGKEGIRQYFDRMMKGPDRVVESVKTDFIPDALSILYGDDLAIAFGHTDDHYVLTSGSSFDIQARWSATLRRQNGKWLVASFHYSTDMFDNPILATQRRLLIGAGSAFGLIAAGIAFWFGRRRRTA